MSFVMPAPALLSATAAAAAFGARAREVCKDIIEALRHATDPTTDVTVASVDDHDADHVMIPDPTTPGPAAAAASPRHLALLFEKLPTRKAFPDYYRVISHPTDLKSIHARLRGTKAVAGGAGAGPGPGGGSFTSCREFANAVERMCSNAEDFNADDSQVHADAGALRRIFVAAMREHFPKEPLPSPHAPVPDPSQCIMLGGALPPPASTDRPSGGSCLVGLAVRVWREAGARQGDAL